MPTLILDEPIKQPRLVLDEPEKPKEAPKLVLDTEPLYPSTGFMGQAKEVIKGFPRGIAEVYGPRIKEIPRDIKAAYFPREPTAKEPSPRALEEALQPLIDPYTKVSKLRKNVTNILPFLPPVEVQNAFITATKTGLESWRRATEMVKAPLIDYQTAVRAGKKPPPIERAMSEAVRGLRITPGREIVKQMGVPLDEPDWVLDNPVKHFLGEMLGAWYETYGTDPVIMASWAKSVPYARKAHLYNTLLKETEKKGASIILGESPIALSPKLARKMAKNLSGGFWGKQVELAQGLKNISETELKQAIKAVKGAKYIPKVKPKLLVEPGVVPVKPAPVVKPVPVRPPVAPKVPVKAPLIEEAKKAVAKGMTKEEFVAKQPKLFSGISKDFTQYESPLGEYYFTDNPDLAKEYSELRARSEWQDRVVDVGREKAGDKYAGANVVEAALDIKNPYVAKLSKEWTMEEQRNIIDKAKSEGFDSVIFKNVVDNLMGLGKAAGKSNVTVIFDKSQIKTKPQLTAIYNQAQAKPPVKPEVKDVEIKAGVKKIDKVIAEKKAEGAVTVFPTGKENVLAEIREAIKEAPGLLLGKEEVYAKEGLVTKDVLAGEFAEDVPKTIELKIDGGISIKNNKEALWEVYKKVKTTAPKLPTPPKPKKISIPKGKGREVIVEGFKKDIIAFEKKISKAETELMGVKYDKDLTPKQQRVRKELLQKDIVYYKESIKAAKENIKAKGLKPIAKPSAPSGAATVGVFRSGEDVKLGNIDKIKPVEFPELVEITKDLMGRVPEVSRRLRTALGKFYATEKGKIKLTPDLFKKENSEQLAKTLAHEIGHLVDYLPQQTLKRGNLLGHLLSMRSFLKNKYGMIEVTNKAIRTELKAMSKYWRPWDESKVSASFKNYRDSSKELYADAVSMLFNNPGKLEEVAPQFYRSFFEYLDKKPAVKNAYFRLQETLSHDRETLIRLRRERVREMFTEADYKSSELQATKEKESAVRLKDFWEMFTYGVKSINQPVYRKMAALKKQGVHIPDEENPEYLLSGRNYLSGLVKGEFKENIQPIMKNLLENDIDWKTLGESLYYDRIIAGDRSEFANPRGITPKAAEELMASIKETLGDRYKILEDNANKFRGFLKGLSEKAYKEGMLTNEMFDIVKGNDKYVPFQVVEYMENYVAWKTKPQIGTLKDISNPANALLLKAVSTIRAIEGQKIRKSTFKMLEQNFPDEIQEAELQFTGKAQRPIPSRDPKLTLVTYYEKGKLRGKYIDPYIAKSLEGDTLAANKAIMTLLSPVRFLNRKIFRPLFVVYNPGWIPFNFIRDFSRTWKNTPGMSLFRLLKLYGKALRPAKVRTFGLKEGAKAADIEAEKLITKLEKEEILSITWNDFLMGQTTEDVQIQTIFEQMGLAESKKEIPTIVKGFDKVLKYTGIRSILEWIKNTGSLVETLPKTAGYYELEGKMPPQEMRTFIRRNIGSPDFFEKGYLTAATNDVFLFSNACIQAVSADIDIATNPKTRSGFWWKTAGATYVPKILMFAALAGAFGKKVKDMMGDASEYDLTNYTVIPLGRDSKNGKTIYLRIPTDETSRLLGGVMWKAMNAFRNNQSFTRDVADVASLFGGQVPGLSPAIEAPLSTAQFLTGRNPYDSFRGRLALTRKQMDAGGWYATKPFLIWQFQQMGGNIFMKLYAGERTPTVKSTGEKVLQSPVISNIVGRFIKISDYGAIERYRKTTSIAKQNQARKSIDENKILNDYIKQYQEKKETEFVLSNKMIKEILGHAPQNKEEARKVNSLRKKFRISIVRGKADPVINSFISAWTNSEKLELLKVFKEEMSQSEFAELKQTLRKYRIVSNEVF